jgi:hypothetical protein
LNGRVCYLSRAGDGLAGVRLVGTRSDESYEIPLSEGEGADAIKVSADVKGAAAWIAERANSGIGLLCVDVDGSNCQWVTAPSTEPVLVAAALDRGAESGAWSSAGQDSASVQALAPPSQPKPRGLLAKKGPETESAGKRLSVLAVPDTLARLVVDSLDDRGISVEHAASLWHAMAMAWDPASPVLSSGVRGDGLVEGIAPVSAVVLIEPGGRVLWCWSRAGELLAGGVVLTAAGEDSARIGRGDVGRLVADWLGWSVQIGVAPVRVACVLPRLEEGREQDLSPAQVGSLIGQSWAGATVDMAVHEDPIGATLARLASAESGLGSDADTRASLVSLGHRPGRTHRSMHVWSALALAAAAAGFIGIGRQAWRGASAAEAERVKAAEGVRKSVIEAAPPPSGDSIQLAVAQDNPVAYLKGRIDSKVSSGNSGLPPAKPILSELEDLSLVLGSDQIEIDQLILSDSLVQVWVFVPDTVTAENLADAIKNMAGDHCDWTLKFSEGGGGGGARGKENMKLIWLDGSWKHEGETKQ